MLTAVKEMSTIEAFLNVSRHLLKPECQAALFSEVTELGIPLCYSDMWSDDMLYEAASSDVNILYALRDTKDEPLPVMLVHRFQLLGECNPGIQDFINNYLERACV